MISVILTSDDGKTIAGRLTAAVSGMNEDRSTSWLFTRDSAGEK